MNGNASRYLAEENLLIVSVDEKCGIQALERAKADLPMTKKYTRKREFNYERHGTQTLIAGLEIATGQVRGQVGDTRGEKDFVEFIEYVLEESGSTRYLFIMDQLNTHKSESLVRLAAKLNDDKEQLGVKGKSGILKNMNTRMNYLNQTKGKIQFAYTPKHCSWLNLIEVWFSQLAKRVIKTGNFKSVGELANKILNYLKYYNDHLAKKFKWSATKSKNCKNIINKVKRYLSKFKG